MRGSTDGDDRVRTGKCRAVRERDLDRTLARATGGAHGVRRTMCATATDARARRDEPALHARDRRDRLEHARRALRVAEVALASAHGNFFGVRTERLLDAAPLGVVVG